jgi:hypothetical protein
MGLYGVPPLLAYLHTGSTPLVRRVDNPALLLSTSLRLASRGRMGLYGRHLPWILVWLDEAKLTGEERDCQHDEQVV